MICELFQNLIHPTSVCLNNLEQMAKLYIDIWQFLKAGTIHGKEHWLRWQLVWPQAVLHSSRDKWALLPEKKTRQSWRFGVLANSIYSFWNKSQSIPSREEAFLQRSALQRCKIAIWNTVISISRTKEVCFTKEDNILHLIRLRGKKHANRHTVWSVVHSPT